MSEIPRGFCQCGCGEKTNLAVKNRRGYRIGESKRYLLGHHLTTQEFIEEHHAKYQGGWRYTKDGYKEIRQDDNTYKLEHHIVAERALGKSLPENAVVHHVNGIRDDNRPENLVICEDQAYHAHIHKRQRALEESGDANNEWCWFCQSWDDPTNGMTHNVSSRRWAHRSCRAAYERERRASS